MSKQAVISAYKNMTSIKTITATYGIPLHQLYAWLDAAGVPRRRKKANRPVNVVDAIKRRAKRCKPSPTATACRARLFF